MLEDSPVFADLRAAYASGDLVVFAGAGISAAAGLPTWNALAKRLLERLRATHAPTEAVDEVAYLVEHGQLVDALSAAKLALGAVEFDVEVEKACSDDGHEVPEVARAIAALAPRLRAVLTTNLDGFLERAFEGEWPMLARATGDIAARRRYILKLHGTLWERSTWVFSREQYDRALFASPVAQGAFEALFRTCPVLFVGCGLADDDLDQTFAAVRALAGGQPSMHYALVPKGVQPFRRRKLEATGLRLLEYENADGKHGEVARLLRLLIAEEGAPRGPKRDDGGPVLGESDRVLADELERICKLRRNGAKVTRRPSPEPFGEQLLVEVMNGRVVETTVVAGLPHGVDDALLDRFLAEVDGPSRALNPFVRSELVYGGPRASEDLLARAARLHVAVQSLAEYQGLIDFRGYVAAQTAKLKADPLYPPGLYVTQRAVVAVGREDQAAPDALAEALKLLDTPHGRFLLVLADFGTGKTFLLHELARRLGEREDGAPTPLFVEMRALEKARSFDALVAQHLALAGEKHIDLAAFRYMLENGRLVLFFDGFDELALRVSYDRAVEHFDTLIEAAQGNAKIVVSSRSQHFVSERQVKTALADRADRIPGARMVKLQPFDHGQIHAFLVNRLGNEKDAARRFALLDQVKDLLGLSANPRMLSFIAEVEEEKLVEAKKRDGEITSAGLYRLLLERWLVFEFERAHPKGAPPGLDRGQRWKAVTELATRLWGQTEKTLDVQALPAELCTAIQALGPHPIEHGEVRHQVGSGTLLVRDEDGRFSFVHQSVLEWLVADAAAEEAKQGTAPTALAVREMSDLMADFFGALAGEGPVTSWFARAFKGAAGEIEAKNALRVQRRLGLATGWGVDLSGKDLRGEDLAGRDLRGANLRGANLEGVRLLGANLQGANLAEARLRGADLSRAVLADADLTRADLTGARLLGADLRRAKLTGAVLRYAALVGAELGSGTLEGADTFAVAPSHPTRFDVTMAPSSSEAFCVCISHDGMLVASGHANGTVRVWDTSSGALRRILEGHMNSVWSLAFAPDGLTLASASHDNTVRLWATTTGALRTTLEGHKDHVWSVAFAPNSVTLASASNDNTVRLWDTSSGALRRTLEGHKNRVWSVAFAPDGLTLASASTDRTVRLWDTSSGTLRRALEGHTNYAWSVAFAPDGLTLASASSDAVRLWDISSGALRRTLEGHKNWVRSVAFAPDGLTLASASDDKTVCLWDTSSGALRRTFEGHQNASPTRLVEA